MDSVSAGILIYASLVEVCTFHSTTRVEFHVRTARLLLFFSIADGARLLIQQGDVGCLQQEACLFSRFDDARGGTYGFARQMGLSLSLYHYVSLRTRSDI